MRDTITYDGKIFPVISDSGGATRSPKRELPHRPSTSSKKPTHWQSAKGPHRVILTPLDGQAVPGGALALSAVPPSLNNVFLNTAGGRIKSPAYRQWITRCLRDLRSQGGWHVPGKVAVRLVFRRGETRADLDNLIKPCLDLLVSAGRIADDRNVVKVEALFADDLSGVRIEIAAFVSPEHLRSSPSAAKELDSKLQQARAA